MMETKRVCVHAGVSDRNKLCGWRWGQAVLHCYAEADQWQQRSDPL